MYMGLSGIIKKRLPVKMAFILSRNIKKMESVVQDVDDNRNRLMEKYGEKDKDGNLVVEDNGNVRIVDARNFMGEFNEILSTDVELTLDKISRKDIERCDEDGYDKLTLEEITALESMIAEDPDE